MQLPCPYTGWYRDAGQNAHFEAGGGRKYIPGPHGAHEPSGLRSEFICPGQPPLPLPLPLLLLLPVAAALLAHVSRFTERVK